MDVIWNLEYDLVVPLWIGFLTKRYPEGIHVSGMQYFLPVCDVK